MTRSVDLLKRIASRMESIEECTKEAILARRKREKAFKGTRWSRLDRRTNPELYETDDED